MSYAQSAEDILQNVDEPFKKDSNTSDSAAEPQPKPSCDRAKIVICIQDKDEVKHFRVYMVHIHFRSKSCLLIVTRVAGLHIVVSCFHVISLKDVIV